MPNIHAAIATRAEAHGHGDQDRLGDFWLSWLGDLSALDAQEFETLGATALYASEHNTVTIALDPQGAELRPEELAWTLAHELAHMDRPHDTTCEAVPLQRCDSDADGAWGLHSLAILGWHEEHDPAQRAFTCGAVGTELQTGPCSYILDVSGHQVCEDLTEVIGCNPGS